MIPAKTIAEVLKEAFVNGTGHLSLSSQTLEEICRHLEGKAKRLSLSDVQDWCQMKESQRDPIFIIPNDGPAFWILEEDDVDEFHKSVLTGRYACWTGRPTESQLREAAKVG